MLPAQLGRREKFSKCMIWGKHELQPLTKLRASSDPTCLFLESWFKIGEWGITYVLCENAVHRVSKHYHALLMLMRISEMHLTTRFSIVCYIVILKFFSDTFFICGHAVRTDGGASLQQGLSIRSSRGEFSLQQRVPQFSTEILAQGRLRSLNAGEHWREWLT